MPATKFEEPELLTIKLNCLSLNVTYFPSHQPPDSPSGREKPDVPSPGTRISQGWRVWSTLKRLGVWPHGGGLSFCGKVWGWMRMIKRILSNLENNNAMLKALAINGSCHNRHILKSQWLSPERFIFHPHHRPGSPPSGDSGTRLLPSCNSTISESLTPPAWRREPECSEGLWPPWTERHPFTCISIGQHVVTWSQMNCKGGWEM